MARKFLLVCACFSVALGLSLRVLRADDTAIADTKDIQKLVGTWKRVGTLDKEGKVMPWTEKYTQFKLVTPTHFTWFYANPKTHEATIGFTGRCTAKGDTYTETVDLQPGTVGDLVAPAKPDANIQAAPTAEIPPVVCKSRLDGNRWYNEIPGFLFADKMPQKEVWERLKPGEKMF